MTLSNLSGKSAATLIGDKPAHRKKQMFTVLVRDWFKGASYSWLQETLQKSELLKTVLIAPEVDLMLERHKTGVSNRTRELRALEAFALWDEGQKA